ncbi:MAG: NAD-dependent epimerase/dehydratase family protein [Chloroflexota bacterium]
MTKLITGGSGQIGAELAHILVNRGEDVVIFDIFKSSRLKDIENKLTFVRGNVGIWSEVMDVVKNNKITQIYHMGAMLTFESESNPWASFQSNVVGTYNVLEAVRLLDVEKIMFTSSIGTFGSTIGAFGAPVEDNLTDTTLQRPGSFYGIGKLYCEGLGRWYNRKFGLDFRGVRYPSVVGPGIATPGHWDAPMMQSALSGKPYKCNVPEDITTAMLYYKDAARAADMILQAPKESIKMMNYNIGGVPAVTPKEVELEIKKHIPGAVITYASGADAPGRLSLRAWDDSYARKEWGWRPEYSTTRQIVSSFIHETRANPELYGLS